MLHFLLLARLKFISLNAEHSKSSNQRLSQLPFPDPPNMTSEEPRIRPELDLFFLVKGATGVDDCVASALFVEL